MSNTQGHYLAEKQGSTLLFVLVIILVIAAILMQILTFADNRRRENSFFVQQTQLHNALLNVLPFSLKRLADDENLLIDHLQEQWAQPVKIVDPTGIKLHISIIDANRYFNLNNLQVQQTVGIPGSRSTQEVIHEILTAYNHSNPSKALRALSDWIDSDNVGPYEKLPYPVANQGLETWEELLLVEGFNPELFNTTNTIQNVVTIWPGTYNHLTKVNINTASRQVLLGTLGSSQQAFVDSLIDLRTENPIRSIEKLPLALGEHIRIALHKFTDVKSPFFILQSSAEQHGHIGKMEALLHRQADGTVEVMRWIM